MGAARIVMTRQTGQARPWTARLRDAGLTVLELPLLRFEALAVPDDLTCGDFDWILFASPNGVRTFLAAGLVPGQARLGALGPGTQAALAASGLADHVNLPHNDGAGFAAAFLAANPQPGRVLLPGPVDRRREIPDALEAAGFTTRVLDLYRTVAVAPAELPDQPFADGDVVFFCSPSAVKAFAAKWTDRPAAVAIGGTTARALDDIAYSHRVAAAPDLDSMVQAIGLSLAGPFSKPE